MPKAVCVLKGDVTGTVFFDQKVRFNSSIRLIFVIDCVILGTFIDLGAWTAATIIRVTV